MKSLLSKSLGIQRVRSIAGYRVRSVVAGQHRPQHSATKNMAMQMWHLLMRMTATIHDDAVTRAIDTFAGGNSGERTYPICNFRITGTGSKIGQVGIGAFRDDKAVDGCLRIDILK